MHDVHKDGHDEQEYVLKISDKSDDKAIMIQVNYENISAVNNDNRNCDHVFNFELGKLSEPVHLTLDESIMPRAVMSSRVPISMKKKLAAKLIDLEQSSVIQKVDKPTE